MDENKKLKHIFFDMDGTITESRTAMEPMWFNPMKELARKYDIVIVSGAREEQMERQVPSGIFPAWRMTQNGNVTISNRRTVLWRNDLNWVQKKAVLSWIDALLHTDKVPVGFGDRASEVIDLVEDRGCQISYSAIGHNAPLYKKKEYDPDGSKRAQLLVSYPFNFMAKALGGDIQWAIGGTTCIDFYTKTKGENIAEMIRVLKWEPDECVYVGDALFKGGNDATVMGIIPIHPVSRLEDTVQFIKGLLA